MNIDVIDETGAVTADLIDLLRRLLIYSATKEDIPSHAEISLNVVDNKKIQAINFKYRQDDKPTDVISFAMQEQTGEEIDINDDYLLPYVLGDIVISLDKAMEQAESYNHSMERELAFLTVHGFLHLLGYNHIEKTDEEMMFKRQEAILSGFGLER